MESAQLSKYEIEEKIKRYEGRLEGLSKRYEWTLSAEEVRSKKRLVSNLKKLSKQLAQVCAVLNDEDSDDLTMTTMGSCDTLSTMCSSVIDSQSDSYSRNYVPMLPLIPPTPTKTDISSSIYTESPINATNEDSMRSQINTPSSICHDYNNKPITSDENDENRNSTIEKHVAYSFSIPKGLFNGITLMLLVGVCTKWYMATVQHRKR
jgi:hypothetical protein